MGYFLFVPSERSHDMCSSERRFRFRGRAGFCFLWLLNVCSSEVLEDKRGGERERARYVIEKLLNMVHALADFAKRIVEHSST